jgi:Flp pilus assembly protein TadD
MTQNKSDDLVRFLQNAEARHAAGELREAVVMYRLILEQYPELIRTAYNLGIALNDLELYAEAESAFCHALTLQADFPEAELNLYFAIQEQGHFPDAINGYSRLISHPLTAPFARFNLACLQLLTGDLVHGWEGYELRFASLQPVASRHANILKWNGTLTPGTRLLVHTEQGYGDAIHMARYLPILAQHGIDVHLETSPSLASLLANLPGLKSCSVRDTPLPIVDCQAPIMSLPGLLGTTLKNIPATVPYLTADEDKIRFWKNLLPETPHLRVGLAWAGRLDLPVNRKRSISPTLLEPLLDSPDVLFISLQQSVPDEFSTSDSRIRSYAEHLRDFHDTAALIANLDLVITIDTAVAHLAGAMGIPTWLLLPFVPDWRWLLERDSSPWYPSMWLFRQAALDEWRSVIQNIQQELHKHLHPVFFCYKPNADFIPPSNLGARLIPLLTDANGVLAEGVNGSITSDYAQADLLLFPYYLEHLTEHISIAAMRSFVTALPFYKGCEERHVFFSDHDSAARYHTKSIWCRASVDAANHDDLAFALPYHTEDLNAYLHFNPDDIRCHTSFVGYIGTRRERAVLLNGIIKEKRLVSIFDTVDSFHGHQTAEIRQQRRTLYLKTMAESLSVLCPEGAGVNSIRFFEALSMGRIPVLVSNALLPYHDRIDYDRFVIRIDPQFQGEAGAILFAWLESRTSDEIMACCRLARATWEQWFSPDAMGRALCGLLMRTRLQKEHLLTSRRGDPADFTPVPSCAENPLQSFLVCLEQNDLLAAQNALKTALHEDPCNPVLHNMCGLLALRTGDNKAAERAFLEALQYDHRNYETYLELGALYRNSGRDEEAAARYFEAGLVRPDCPKPFLEAIPSLRRLGRHQEVLYCRTKAQQLGATSAEISSIETSLINPLASLHGSEHV